MNMNQLLTNNNCKEEAIALKVWVVKLLQGVRKEENSPT